MTEHIRKAHPDHVNLTGIDVRYFGEMLRLIHTANRASIVPLTSMQLLWVIRMEKLANRPEFIDIANEPQPEPEVLPAIDVEQRLEPCLSCGTLLSADTAKLHKCPDIAAFEDDGGYTGPAHD